jgi:hypothetical protein
MTRTEPHNQNPRRIRAATVRERSGIRAGQPLAHARGSDLSGALNIRGRDARTPLRAFVPSCLRPSLPAFTIIELIVVIVIVGLLTTLIIAGASRAIYSSRAAYTRQIMSNTLRGVDIFATENPLRLIYGATEGRGFAPFPPYVLANAGGTYSSDKAIVGLLETKVEESQVVSRLSYKLSRDLGRPRGEKRTPWVQLGKNQQNERDGNDDIRALYAYLKAFTPSALEQVPEGVLKPLNPLAQADPNQADLMNPTGQGPEPGEPDNAWVDILGIHDAWDVPLDYFLYVKVEWKTRRITDPRDSRVGQTAPAWVITDRVPVLRSRGVQRETYDAWIAALENGDVQSSYVFNRPSNWIFSSELPRPWFPDKSTANNAFADQDRGTFVSQPGTTPPPGGWLRAVGREAFGNFDADYRYLPSHDQALAEGN